MGAASCRRTMGTRRPADRYGGGVRQPRVGGGLHHAQEALVGRVRPRHGGTPRGRCKV
jgi:hypothetical protein